jgi:hypothetical protein
MCVLKGKERIGLSKLWARLLRSVHSILKVRSVTVASTEITWSSIQLRLEHAKTGIRSRPSLHRATHSTMVSNHIKEIPSRIIAS